MLWASFASGSSRLERSRSKSGSQCQNSGSTSLTFEPPPGEDVDILRKGGQAAVLHMVQNPHSLQEGEIQAERVLLNADKEHIEEVELSPKSVLLHLYDLSESLHKCNEVLAFSSDRLALGGAFHVGVEVLGGEWSYGSYGVASAVPRTAVGHIYRCSILLGNTGLDDREIAEVMHDLCQEWGASDYQVIGHNCCSFAADMCERLGVGCMPPWVNRFARFLHASSEVAYRQAAASNRALQAAVRISRGLGRNATRLLDRVARNMTPRSHAHLADSDDSEWERDPGKIEEIGLPLPSSPPPRTQQLQVSWTPSHVAKVQPRQPSQKAAVPPPRHVQLARVVKLQCAFALVRGPSSMRPRHGQPDSPWQSRENTSPMQVVPEEQQPSIRPTKSGLKRGLLEKAAGRPPPGFGQPSIPVGNK